MALSSTPADPPSSTAAAAATTPTPRLFTTAPPPSRDPRPPPISPYPHPPSHYHHQHRLPSQQPQQQPLYASQPPFANLAPRGPATAAANRGVLYPVASSGRGFLPKTSIRPSQSAADQILTIANQAGFPPRSGPPYSQTVRAFGFPHSDPHAHLIRPPHLQHNFLGSTGGVMSGAGKGVPVSGQLKVAPSHPSVSECNGYKDQRFRSRDDTFATVRDRKVRIYEGSSLYALCRSWLRNGCPEETQLQPQYVDGVKLLPKPLPTLVPDAPIKKEDGEEEEERPVENLSPQDLLQRHVKRAKRVRAHRFSYRKIKKREEEIDSGR